MRWLILEPYYGGSHRALVDGLSQHLELAYELWVLPPRKWKWRMRGAALEFARRVREERPLVDAILTSSLCNAAELRGILPAEYARLPLLVYFHENQLRYPLQQFDKRDHHFAWTNVHSALAADRLLFNSEFNRDSFVEELEHLARKMPDLRPRWAVSRIRDCAEVLPVPIDTQRIEATQYTKAERKGPCHIVWNHRWEYDKGPAALLRLVRELIAANSDFSLSILGQRFQVCPPIFETLRSELGPRLRRWGYLASRQEYLTELATADVALSTALHEFQGLAILEAAACGAIPLVPDGLAYREIWPEPWRYRADALISDMLDRIRRVDHWRRIDPRPIARRYGWHTLGARWTKLLEDPVSAARRRI